MAVPDPGSFLPQPPSINGTDLIDEFTNFTLDFAGGLELSLVIAITCMVIGGILMFFGSRLFKYTLFTCAFLVGAALGFFIVKKISDDALAGVITAAVLGLIVGGLAIKMWKLSLFVLGGGCGFILWLTAKALYPDPFVKEEVSYGVLAGLIIVLGLAALKMEKLWLLLATPLVGTFLLCQGVDHFIEEDLGVFALLDQSQASCGLISECYVIYGCLIGGTIVGFLIQWRYTSEYGQKRMKKARYKNEAKKEYEEEADERRKYRRRGS